MVRKLIRAAINTYHAVHRIDALASNTLSLLAREEIRRLQARELQRNPVRPAGHAFRAFSQNDEDGILQEVFRRIGTTNQSFVEIGCGGGLENSTTYLLLCGWPGVWVDGSSEDISAVRRLHKSAIEAEKLKAACCMIAAENINETLTSLGVTQDIDLLSIDIDGNAYWVWAALRCVTPRAMIVEYNATFPPPVGVVQAYHPDARWDGTSCFGASLTALEQLGRSKGYSLAGCNLTGINAVFVGDDCLTDQFAQPYAAQYHYMEPNYDLFPAARYQAHPAGIGELVTLRDDLRIRPEPQRRSAKYLGSTPTLG